MTCMTSSFYAAGLPASPYPINPGLETLKRSETPISPSRRRLPPTPGGSQSSPIMMPEPAPYYPPGAIPPASYSSLSYPMHTSSSGGTPNLSHRTTASSTRSDNSSRHRQPYSNGRSPSDGERTPISSNEYPSHASNASYFTGNYSSNNNTTGDDVYRPPGALSPSVPPHASTSYSTQSPPFNPYANEELHDPNGYQHQEPYQSYQVPSYSSHAFNSPLPPPPFLPVASQHTANEHHFDSSPKYLDKRQLSLPIDASLCMFSQSRLRSSINACY